MADYISRQAAIDALEGCQQYKVSTEDYAVDYAQAKTELMMLPAADVRENITGTWLPIPGGYRCPACQLTEERATPFCPNCGAKLC